MAVTSNKCNGIINNINKMTDTAIEAIKVAQDRAKAAEQTLNKVKQTLSVEINNAYKLGFTDGVKYKNKIDDDTGNASDDVSGGTGKAKEDVAKLVLNNKN